MDTGFRQPNQFLHGHFWYLYEGLVACSPPPSSTGSGTYPKMFSDHALDPEYEPLQDRDHRRPSSIHLPHILAPPEPAFTMKNRR